MDSGHPSWVLVVEDNRTNRHIAKSILEQAGFMVLLAENGKDAVEVFTRNQKIPDIILMDLHMPIMDGYDASKAIRAAGSGVPIIAMTADAVEDIQDECAKAGIDGFITKPFDPENFLRTVGDGLNRTVGAPMGRREEIPNCQTVLDVNDAILRIGKNKELFHRILKEYINENKSVLDMLESMMAKQNFQAAAQLMHKIKGSTGNIGARKLYRAASKLQTSLIGANATEIEADFAVFRSSLEELVDRIDDELST